MSEFNVAKFVANNAGLNIFDALNKAYEQGRADGLTEIINHIKACENEAFDNVEPLIGSVLMAIRVKAEQLLEGEQE